MLGFVLCVLGVTVAVWAERVRWVVGGMAVFFVGMVAAAMQAS